MVFDNSKKAATLNVSTPYFHKRVPIEWESEGDYADPTYTASHSTYQWMHPIGDTVNALIQAGLKIEFLHEFPYICYKEMPFMIQDKNGDWRLEGDPLPLAFSIKAIKPLIDTCLKRIIKSVDKQTPILPSVCRCNLHFIKSSRERNKQYGKIKVRSLNLHGTDA